MMIKIECVETYLCRKLFNFYDPPSLVKIYIKDKIDILKADEYIIDKIIFNYGRNTKK